jgi:nucleotide-binding universal stress UspA family protein
MHNSRTFIQQKSFYKETAMYTRILIPLDGSQTAEKVLPYARFLAKTLKLPVELLQVIDVVEIAKRIAPENAHFLNTVIENAIRKSEEYLRRVAGTVPGADVKCIVEKGWPEDVIIEKAAMDKGTLISMATHGRSGINRWLLGSVAEKVLRGATTPVFLARATEDAKSEGEAPLHAVIVPLDGSELAEQVLPAAAELAKHIKLEIILFRAYNIPYSALAADPEGAYVITDEQLIAALRDEAVAYLEKKTDEMKKMGLEKISCIAEYGLAADEIISLARETPDNFIAMSTHGRSGVRRWVLGSVTETVVRHSGDPVLVIRAPSA